jgi:hypothetical protein
MAGVLSGGTAGLTAVVGWFLVGIPLSYAFIDRLAVPAPVQNLRDSRTPRREPSQSGPTATDLAPAAR